MKAVAYYRVSTATQARSGLGLEAQRAAVADLCTHRGLEIIAEFTEVESGKRNDRPELSEALRRAKLTGATLVVAKLDRLPARSPSCLRYRTVVPSSLQPTCPRPTSSPCISSQPWRKQSGRQSPRAPRKP